MMAANMRRAAKLHSFHGFRRVLMLAFHEPARLVSTERQVGEAELTVLLARGVIIEALVEAGIAYMVDFTAWRFDDEGGPERHASVVKTAGRPVVARFEMNFHRTCLHHIAPISHLDTRRLDTSADDRVIAERRDEKRLVRHMQALQRFHIQMVVVIMGHQHQIDGRQILKTDAGRIDPFGTGKTERAGALRPHRIDENIQTRRLDEK
ncbi:hypothetical protein D3C78_1177180 [compost metagenome]